MFDICRMSAGQKLTPLQSLRVSSFRPSNFFPELQASDMSGLREVPEENPMTSEDVRRLPKLK